MSHTEYVSLREVSLDRRETCEYCGREFAVICRAYGEGSASAPHGILSVILDSHSRAEGRAALGAVQALPKAAQKSILVSYQRCTHCGTYSRDALDAMKGLYRGYREQRSHTSFDCWGCGGLLLLGSLCCMLFIKGVGPPRVVFFHNGGWVLLAVILGLLAAGWIYGRCAPEDAFRRRVDATNDASIRDRWLANYAKEAPPLLECLEKEGSVFARKHAWEQLQLVQHRFDPVDSLSVAQWVVATAKRGEG